MNAPEITVNLMQSSSRTIGPLCIRMPWKGKSLPRRRIQFLFKLVYLTFIRFICICGSARTSPHNKWWEAWNFVSGGCDPLVHPCSFLEGPKAALVASRDFDFGHYKTPPQQGIRAFGRVYSKFLFLSHIWSVGSLECSGAWAYGQTVGRERSIVHPSWLIYL